MKSIYSRAFTLTFYRAFIGLFILLLIIFGVFMRAIEHILLAQYIVQSAIGLSAVLLLFLIYGFFELRFKIKLFHRKDYLLFHQMGLLSKMDFYKTHFRIWLSNNLLIIVYSLFLSYQSLITAGSGIVVVVLIWSVILFLFSGSTIYLYSLLRSPLPEPKISVLKNQWFKGYTISRNVWFIVHLLRNRALLFLGAKSMSLLLLTIFFTSYMAGGYDERWLYFSLSCSAFVNFFIWSEKASFEEKNLYYFLNMPIPISTKIINHLLVFLLILFPELLIIVYQLNSNFLLVINLLLLAISFNAGLYALIRFVPDTDRLLKAAYITFFLLFFLILFHPPLLVLLILGFMPFLLLFRSAYQL